MDFRGAFTCVVCGRFLTEYWEEGIFEDVYVSRK